MSFYHIFTQLLRKIGVMIGPNEIDGVRKKCDELVEEIRNISRDEAKKICLEHIEEIKKALK